MSRAMRIGRKVVLRAAVVASLLPVLVGCAGFGPGPDGSVLIGASRDAVMQRWGKPTAVLKVAGGERLQYSLQPAGQQSWMVDLDATGRVRAARQVLTEAEFQRVEPDTWSRADVEREFGPPAMVDRVASWRGDVITYRWLGVSNMFFWVYVDGGGMVRRTQFGMEFLPDVPERD